MRALRGEGYRQAPRCSLEPFPLAPVSGSCGSPWAAASVEVVDVATKLTHRVSPDEMVSGHRRGDYVAFCDHRFVAACLVEPGCGPCQPCQQRAAS